MDYEMEAPWNRGIRGNQVLPLINEDGGCIRCEAGPGTGKTFGLERRVLRLLSPQGAKLDPTAVLVVAFNRVIAKDLRTKIGEELTNAGYDGALPRISTLHAYCLEKLGLKSRVLLPHEVDAMAYDLVTACPQLTEAHKNHNQVKKAINLQGSGHLDDDLLDDQIQNWLTRHKAGTIGDIPADLLNLIAIGDFDETYDHVIVDEFQDLTPSEQQLVFKLVKDEGTIVALGDRRQSIYRFRGNDQDGLQKIESLTSSIVRDYPMTICQRCPNTFVDAANIVQISSNAPKLEYGNPNPANTHVVVWKGIKKESEGMAKAIVENINAGGDDDNHLAMVTRRAFGYRLRDEIKKLDDSLSVRLVFSESPLETWAVREAFIAFCLLTAPDGPTWRSWLGYRLPSGKQKHMAERRNSPAYLDFLTKSKDKINLDLIRSVVDKSIRLTGAGKGNILERSKRMLEVDAVWCKKLGEPEKFIEEFFWSALWPGNPSDDPETVEFDFETTRMLAHELLAESNTGDAVHDLRNTAIKLRSHIATRDTELVDDEAVDLTIATLWSAKGVTADHVYVIGLCKEAIPGEYREDDYPGTAAEYRDEQKRLFYVSITRSKRTLVLSRAKFIPSSMPKRLGLSSGKISGPLMELSASPFLIDIRSALPKVVRGEDWAGCVLPLATAPESPAP